MTTQSSLFLTRLPVEVRCQVYEKLLKDVVFEVDYHVFGLKWYDDKSMNIAKTCRQCRQEAITVFQGQAIIEVDLLGVLALKGTPGMFNRNRLRRIRLIPKRTPDTAPTLFETFQQERNSERPDESLLSSMLHCLDVFFDLNHLQLRPSVKAKLTYVSSGEPITDIMREIASTASLRVQCFSTLLKKDSILATQLEDLRNAFRTRNPVQDVKLEVMAPLLIATAPADSESGSLSVADFGVSSTLPMVSSNWLTGGSMCSLTSTSSA